MSTLLTIITTAVLTYTFTLSVPVVKQRWNAFKNAKKRKKHTSNIDELVKRVNELEEQLDNVAKNHYRREQNRRNNIRRDVREYLEELRNG